MPTVENIEKKIAKIETFGADQREIDGRNVRGDRENLPTFHGQRAMKGSATVAHWRRVRFDSMYPGFDVNVLYADGTVAASQTRLTTVRDTYYHEDLPAPAHQHRSAMRTTCPGGADAA